MKKIMTKLSNCILPLGVTAYVSFFLLLLILHIPNETKLTGISLTEYPEAPQLSSVMDGSFQDALGKWITDHFYGYPTAVSAHNQIRYSVFQDGTGVYSQGKEGYVFDTNQSLEYVRGERNVIDYAAYDDYALKVSIMQMQLENLGKEFLYILDPVKAEVFEDKLPWRLQVLSERYAKDGNLQMKAMTDAFDKYGVHYYVTTNDLIAMRNQTDYPVFCKTGHHWTSTAAAFEMSAMFRQLRESGAYTSLPEIEVTGISDEVFETDLDAINSFNIKYYQTSEFTSPIVRYESTENKAFMFGTSFGCEIAEAFYRSPDNRAFDEFTFMHYFTHRMTYNEYGEETIRFTQDSDINETDILNRVSESTLIIMEQQAGLKDTHQKFVDYLNENMINGNVGEN